MLTRLLFLSLMLVCASTAGARDSVSEPSQLPARFHEIRPGDLKWVPNPAVLRGEMAVLFGAPAKPGPFAIRVRLSAKIEGIGPTATDDVNPAHDPRTTRRGMPVTSPDDN